VLAHQLFDSHGLPGVRWIAFEAEDHRRSPETTRRRVERELDFPVFVKPSNGGSSVGVTRVVEATDLGAAMQRAFEYDGIVLVEQGIDAREIECAVLGNRRAEASVLGEIVPSREFYSYEAKYEDGTSRLTIPAELDPERTEAIRGHAVTAFHCLGLRGMARVDFLVGRASGLVYLNEVNSLPGFTSISMFPRLWEASGLALPELVRRLVDLAFEQWHAERSLRTAWRTE
jgi:D-alanine-D-alanine ligase